MINKKVLIVGTYPIKSSQHGGQKRAEAIFLIYQKHFKAVQYSAVFHKGFYKDYFTAYDIPLSLQGEQRVQASPLTGDIICGEAIYEDPIVKRKFTKLLQTFNPDIIHIEQPQPYLGLKPLLKELGLKPQLVFGSQNIEAPMKQEILEGIHAPKDFINKTATLLHKLEQELSKDCDLLAACTEADLAVHESMGAKNTVLAQNGIAKSHTDKQNIGKWKDIFTSKGIDQKVLFVGSAHPPNWVGFLTMVGKGLGFLPYNARIVMAGSICDYFDKSITPDTMDIQDATFWLRAYSAGRLSEPDLAALIELADVMILPITEGGGSNLKTAEAVLADKKVVATSHALRSFEWFRDFPNVWIADTEHDFRAAIINAIDTPFKSRSEAQQQQANQVAWENRLAAFIKKVSQL